MSNSLKALAALCTLSILMSPAQAEQSAPAARVAAPVALITPEHAQLIYRHLVERHWVPQTGLFLSFVDSSDRKLSQQASTYEQGVAGLLALRMGDRDRAERIFQFFKTAWVEGPQKDGPRYGVAGLLNFYNAEWGSEGIEKTIHVGPNAWMGLFAAKLANTTGEREPFDWAMQLASWIAHDIPHYHGGVAMGPLYGLDGTPWPKVVSVENNLSYYAFLSELLRSPFLKPADRAWLIHEQRHVEDWLVYRAFDRASYTMYRGYNPQGIDRIRALDTVTWLISALGPDRLMERGINPNQLMHTAQRLFVVRVRNLRGVDPTDQDEADLTFQREDLSRHQTSRPEADQHRMIWYEGLGQYINALNMMSDYADRIGHAHLALDYKKEAVEMTEQFDRASLKNYPEGAAFQYATLGKFFHDGWWPPADGTRSPASSLVAAAWRCMSGLGMDPLAGTAIPTVEQVAVAAPKNMIFSHPAPDLLFGTSEDMTNRAWDLLAKNRLDLAVAQAQATIQEWATFAQRLQEKKALKVGAILPYNGAAEERKEIFSYWALNDVAAAYFILGKALDEKRQYVQAAGAFRQIPLHYSLAQVWDPKGWFWSPVDALQTEIVSKDPRHYRDVVPEVLIADSSVGKLPN